MGTRDSDGILTIKWANAGDTGLPVGFDRNYGWPLAYSQAGGSKPERIAFNLLFKELSALGLDVNKFGCFMPYAATINYVVGAYVQGSDLNMYQCLIANGPSSSIVNPVGDSTSTWIIIAFNAAAGILPQNHLSGMILSNNGSAPNTDLDITAGKARSKDDATNIILTTGLTKQANHTWAAGTNAGGMAAGVSLTANTWYHVFVLGKANNAAGADIGFDTNINATNLLADANIIAAGYTKIRRVKNGSFLTDSSSHIIPAVWMGNTTIWNAATPMGNTTSCPATLTNLTVSSPPNVYTRPILEIYAGMTNNALENTIIKLKSLIGGIDRPVLTVRTESSGTFYNGGYGYYTGDYFWTNLSSQIQHKYDGYAPNVYYVVTKGWIEE
jgi:hypothetical protein